MEIDTSKVVARAIYGSNYDNLTQAQQEVWGEVAKAAIKAHNKKLTELVPKRHTDTSPQAGLSSYMHEALKTAEDRGWNACHSALLGDEA